MAEILPIGSKTLNNQSISQIQWQKIKLAISFCGLAFFLPINSNNINKISENPC